jgi:cytochrome P450
MDLPLGDPAYLEDLLADSVGGLNRLHHAYGKCVAFPNNDWYTVFAFGPECNYPVFTDTRVYHQAGYPGPKGRGQRQFMFGLFGLSGEQQMRHRRLLMPPFRKESVERSFDALSAVVDHSLAGWRPGSILDLRGCMQDLSLQITGRLLFGLDDVGSLRTVAAVFQRWLDAYHKVLFAANLPVAAPQGCYEEMLEASDELVEHFQELVRGKRQTLQATDEDIFALLLRAFDCGQIAERELIGEMHTMINAAYQTTSFALMWMLFLLAQHPHAAQALLEEQHHLLADASLTGEELPRLDYLNCVIKESLRILPSVVYTQRWVTENTMLAGYQVPRGCMVFTSYYVTHHMAELFPEPEQFLPERWQGREVSPYAYLPFSAGARMCMGAAFATLLFKIALTKIWQRFRLEVLPGVRIDRHANLTLGVQKTLPVRLHVQDGRFGRSAIAGDVLEMVALPGAPSLRQAA